MSALAPDMCCGPFWKLTVCHLSSVVGYCVSVKLRSTLTSIPSNASTSFSNPWKSIFTTWSMRTPRSFPIDAAATVAPQLEYRNYLRKLRSLKVGNLDWIRFLRGNRPWSHRPNSHPQQRKESNKFSESCFHRLKR
jgi:hypothetical protein